MANKKVKPCGNFEFLPKEYQEMDTLRMSEKNVLATLCFGRLYYSNYARDNDGWFYCSLVWIANECKIDVSTVKRVITLLRLKKLLTIRSGTNHECTHYKLAPQIVDLLPIEELEEEINEPLDNIRQQNVELTLDNVSKSNVNVLNTVSSVTDDFGELF